MMIAKVHALSKGFSGVSLEVIERMILMLEKDIIPVVPEQGSVEHRSSASCSSCIALLGLDRFGKVIRFLILWKYWKNIILNHWFRAKRRVGIN
jgi:hypothetical protein